LSSGRAEGMCTLETWLNHLVENGVVTYDDAISRSAHPKEIKLPAGVQAASLAMAPT
jgi:twitching motility protein PilT